MKQSTQLVLFSDLNSFAKENEELIWDLLKDVHGKFSDLKKYPEADVVTCVRYLIYKGYLRGTIIDCDKCIWSQATKKGKYYYKLLDSLKNKK